MTSTFLWEQPLEQLYDLIFMKDARGQDRRRVQSHTQYLRNIDPALFDQVADIGARLQGNELYVFCCKVRQLNATFLQDDEDYGHMGLGIGGLKAVFDRLTQHPVFVQHDLDGTGQDIVDCVRMGLRPRGMGAKDLTSAKRQVL